MRHSISIGTIPSKSKLPRSGIVISQFKPPRLIASMLPRGLEEAAAVAWISFVRATQVARRGSALAFNLSSSNQRGLLGRGALGSTAMTSR